MKNADEKIVTEEQEQKDTERFQELNKIEESDRTDEQRTELGELKERYGKRMQKKIDSMHSKTKSLEEENERLKQEVEEIKKSVKPAEKEVITESLKSETTEIAGKKWFTDKALIAQVKSGEISEDEAYAYQRKRDREEDRDILRKERDTEERKNQEINVRKEDADFVKKNYPHFDKKNSDFNPEDPLYKLANELYLEGYIANPKGLSLAIKRAKEILRISDDIDRSEDHSVERSNPPEKGSDKSKETTLTEYEKEAAIKQWTRGDVMNPKTGRPYTENEAIAKALAAKKSRRI